MKDGTRLAISLLQADKNRLECKQFKPLRGDRATHSEDMKSREYWPIAILD